mgnify:CR=1 FL=1
MYMKNNSVFYAARDGGVLCQILEGDRHTDSGGGHLTLP